jgi:hypothetical protein
MRQHERSKSHKKWLVLHTLNENKTPDRELKHDQNETSDLVPIIGLGSKSRQTED